MPHQPVYAPDATPVIIAGAPRSGTTFLTTALNTHPQILITNELRVWNVFNDIRRRTRKPGEMLPEHVLRDKFRKKMINSLAPLFEEFYREHVTGENLGCSSQSGDSVEPVIKAYGDKNPGYADTHNPGCVDFIARYLPKAKFLHIYRDARSCAASYKAISIYSDKIDRCIDIWRRHVQTMADLQEAIGNRVLTFSYDRFVTEQGGDFYRAIEDHLGVDHAEEPQAFLVREREKPTPYRSPTTPHDKLGQKTYQERLTPSEIEQIDNECGPLMEKLATQLSIPAP